MTPPGGYFANIAGIAVGAVVSFLISAFLLKMFGKDSSLEEAQAQVAASKAASKGQAVSGSSTGAAVSANDVKKIVLCLRRRYGFLCHGRDDAPEQAERRWHHGY